MSDRTQFAKSDLYACSELARQARDLYPLKEWPDIEPMIRRVWEFQGRRPSWEQAQPIVADEWNKRSGD